MLSASESLSFPRYIIPKRLSLARARELSRRSRYDECSSHARAFCRYLKQIRKRQKAGPQKETCTYKCTRDARQASYKRALMELQGTNHSNNSKVAK